MSVVKTNQGAEQTSAPWTGNHQVVMLLPSTGHDNCPLTSGWEEKY